MRRSQINNQKTCDMAISFQTSRLIVDEVKSELPSSALTPILEVIPQILTPQVVQNLPPYFHNIDSIDKAEIWLKQMLSESRLLLVKSDNQQLIGFLFASSESDNEAHIGYLLTEQCWGKGLASELLQGFIAEATKAKTWTKLIGGVDRSNLASIHLLTKLSFTQQQPKHNDVLFFEYCLPSNN